MKGKYFPKKVLTKLQTYGIVRNVYINIYHIEDK